MLNCTEIRSELVAVNANEVDSFCSPLKFIQTADQIF